MSGDQIIERTTDSRNRDDRLMHFGWKAFLPVSLFLVSTVTFAAEMSEEEANGTLIACFFNPVAGSPGKEMAGLAVFLPMKGLKQKLSAAQLRNPDGVVSEAGFSQVQIDPKGTKFSGKNSLTLRWTGAEMYNATLTPESGSNRTGVCQVGSMAGREKGFTFFDSLRASMRKSSSDKGATQ